MGYKKLGLDQTVADVGGGGGSALTFEVKDVAANVLTLEWGKHIAVKRVGTGLIAQGDVVQLPAFTLGEELEFENSSDANVLLKYAAADLTAIQGNTTKTTWTINTDSYDVYPGETINVSCPIAGRFSMKRWS